MNQLSEWNVDGRNLAAAITLADRALAMGLVAARVDIYSCLGLLNLLPAHQVGLVKVLAHVDKVVGAVKTVDVDYLHA